MIRTRLDVLTALGLAVFAVGACFGPAGLSDAPSPSAEACRSAEAAPLGGDSIRETLYVPIALPPDGERPAWQSRATVLANRAAAERKVAVRNTDPDRPIRIESACGHDAGGEARAEALPHPVQIPPLAVHTIALPRRPGDSPVASVLIRWGADGPVRAPIASEVRGVAVAGSHVPRVIGPLAGAQ